MKLDELRKRIAEELNVDPACLIGNAGPGTLAEWDSMGSLGIISVLDSASRGSITSEEAEQLVSFDAVVSLARKKGILED
jgi:acyl carrier protein